MTARANINRGMVRIIAALDWVRQRCFIASNGWPVVMLGGYEQCEIDFVADNPGLTLFHRHQQLHMDYGFMTLLDYVKTKVGAFLANAWPLR